MRVTVRRRVQNAISPTGLIAGVCGIALIGFFIFLPKMAYLSGNSWLALLWLTWGISLTWALTRSSFSIIFTALMLSMFIFIIVPATGAQLYDKTLLAGHDYQAGVILAIKISVLAQAAMLVGAIGARVLCPVPNFERIDIRVSADRLDKATFVAVMLAFLGLIGMSALGGANLRDFFVYTTSGGYGTFWSELHTSLGYLVAVQCVGSLAIVLLPLRLNAACSRRRVFPVAAAILASLILLGGGQRGPFIGAVSAAGLVWLKTSRKRRRQRGAVMLGALLLLLISGFVGVARAAVGSREVTFGNVVAEPFGAGDNLFLPIAGMAMTVPAEISYLHGASYLQVFVLPIPRAIWPTKPSDDITTIITRFDSENSGLAFPAFGEGYANFGLMGAALSGVILGAVSELLHRRFAGSRDLKASLGAAVLAGVFLQLFSRGDFAPMFTTYIGILAAVAYIGRRRSKILDPVAISWQMPVRRDVAQSRVEAVSHSSVGI